MNLYARVSDLKQDITATSTVHEAEYVRALEDASRAVESHCGRAFHSQIATRYFDGRGVATLLLQADLLSVSTIKVDDDGDGTYEKTLVVNTDYWLYPDNEARKWRIDMNPHLPQIGYFPKGRRRVEVAGTWGYSNDTELTGAVLDEADDGAETALHVDSPSLIDVGETIVIGTEQLYVSKVDGNILTVARGINGTTAAAHDTATAVYRRRYPADVEWATRIIALRQLWGAAGGQQGLADFGGQPPEMMGQSARSASPWRVLAPYRMPVVA